MAGCTAAAPDDAPAAAARQTAPAASDARRDPDRPAGGPATAETLNAAKAQAEALAAARARLGPIDDDPDQFLGLGGLEVARRLGAPQIVRRDGAAEVWVYLGAGCTVDVFLYAGDGAAAGNGLVARFVDLRSPAKTAAEGRRCLKAMLEREALRQAGA
eukprot:g13592.t1